MYIVYLLSFCVPSCWSWIISFYTWSMTDKGCGILEVHVHSQDDSPVSQFSTTKLSSEFTPNYWLTVYSLSLWPPLVFLHIASGGSLIFPCNRKCYWPYMECRLEILTRHQTQCIDLYDSQWLVVKIFAISCRMYENSHVILYRKAIYENRDRTRVGPMT